MNQKKIVSTWKWFSHMDRVFGRSPIYLAFHIGNLLWFPQLSFQILSQLEATRQVTSTTCQEAKAELYFGVSQVGSWPSGREDKRQVETEDFLGKYKKVCGKGTAALLGSLRTRRNNKWLRCSVSTSLVPFALLDPWYPQWSYRCCTKCYSLQWHTVGGQLQGLQHHFAFIVIK